VGIGCAVVVGSLLHRKRWVSRHLLASAHGAHRGLDGVSTGDVHCFSEERRPEKKRALIGADAASLMEVGAFVLVLGVFCSSGVFERDVWKILMPARRYEQGTSMRISRSRFDANFLTCFFSARWNLWAFSSRSRPDW
jgi:hypothetical protein